MLFHSFFSWLWPTTELLVRHLLRGQTKERAALRESKDSVLTTMTSSHEAEWTVCHCHLLLETRGREPRTDITVTQVFVKFVLNDSFIMRYTKLPKKILNFKYFALPSRHASAHKLWSELSGETETAHALKARNSYDRFIQWILICSILERNNRQYVTLKSVCVNGPCCHLKRMHPNYYSNCKKF